MLFKSKITMKKASIFSGIEKSTYYYGVDTIYFIGLILEFYS